VSRKGVLQQIAPPQELYDRPKNLFVAGFIGSPAMNFLSGTLQREDGHHVVDLGANRIRLEPAVVSARPALQNYVDQPVIIGIRPEEMEDAALATGGDGTTLDAVVELVEPLGSDLVVHLSVDAREAKGLDDIQELAEDSGETLPSDADRATVVARFSPRSRVQVGDTVKASVTTDQMHFFDANTGEAISS
jgi:multiple sugar transport system ATP-binding protein